ncbi:MAG: hypothetical protein WAM39_13455 [Bryobacteraceae bacterium]
MLTRRKVLVSALALPPFTLVRADDEKYKGPVPPKKDIPYLLHADNLVETEVVTASQTSKKDDQIFSVSGETSSARTPLAEPIFLMAPDRLVPSSLGLYRFEISGGHRQIAIKKRGKGVKSYHTSVRDLAPGLVRVEAAEYLENGEYCLSPEGENTAFCFTVY